MQSNSELVTESTGSYYTDIQRLEAVTAFTVHGSFKKVSEYTNVPMSTLYDWSKLDWWQSELGKLREQNKDLIRAKVAKLVATGFDAIQDRVDNGDEYITKDGEKARKLVSARDLGTVTGIAFDKLRLIDNQPTSISASGDITITLNQFRDLAKARTIEGEIVNEGLLVQDDPQT